MMTRFCTVLLAVALRKAQGHIYQLYPMSRSFANSESFLDMDDPNFDGCPHCYNAHGSAGTKARGNELMDPDVLAKHGGGIDFPLSFVPRAPNGNYLEPNEVAVRHGVCGDPEQNKLPGSNTYSTASSNWEPLTTFQSGQDLEFNVVMNAYHWGHLEFFICNADNDPSGIPTQECFNEYPLTRAEGDDDNSPIDPDFPGRYYCDPTCRGEEDEVDQTKPLHAISGENMKMRYVLPDIECSHCILQMVYHTGNTCHHIGYEGFNPPSWPSACAPNKEDWVDTTGEACGQEGYYPEEFWACSDFSITSDGPPSSTPPEETTPAVTEPTGCAEEWEQCGGAGGDAVGGVWTGPTCCVPGTTCYYKDVYWSDCRPAECAEEWEQCGGSGGGAVNGVWTGPTCCEVGTTCHYKDQYWSDCRPAECAEEWDQCGGSGGDAVNGVWTGPTCCEVGTTCYYKDQYWSECRPNDYNDR
ncbi:unnamed protein product [Ectocarpus sp. 6 AP-2014]